MGLASDALAMSARITHIDDGGSAGGFSPRQVGPYLARPPIIDNDHGNPDLTVECEGDLELPVLLCDCLYGMGFQVVACRTRVAEGRAHVCLTVAESDGSALDDRRRRQALTLVDAVTDPALAAE
jgi:hypothetical protein